MYLLNIRKWVAVTVAALFLFGGCLGEAAYAGPANHVNSSTARQASVKPAKAKHHKAKKHAKTKKHAKKSHHKTAKKAGAKGSR
jgi:hypothetical protein